MNDEETLLAAIAIDPFDDGLIRALRSIRREGSAVGRETRYRVGLLNILASIRDEEDRRWALLSWATALYSDPEADPVEAAYEQTGGSE